METSIKIVKRPEGELSHPMTMYFNQVQVSQQEEERLPLLPSKSVQPMRRLSQLSQCQATTL